MTTTRNETIKLAAEHHMSLVSFAYACLKDWSEAEDIVQESYIVLARKWKEYDGERSILPWFRAIVRIQCLRHKHARKMEYLNSNDFLAEMMDSNSDLFTEETDRKGLESREKMLLKYISNLTPRNQKLIFDFYVMGRSCKQIAKAEGTKEQSVSMRLWRTRVHLRNCMKKRISVEEKSNSTGNYWQINNHTKHLQEMA